jgi:hypothetical protein
MGSDVTGLSGDGLCLYFEYLQNMHAMFLSPNVSKRAAILKIISM